MAVVRVGDGRVVAVVAVEVVAVVVAVVADDGAVVADDGAVVAVGRARCVDWVLVADPARSVSMAVIELGLGTDAPEGTKATVMS